jgi:hypothetical protein
VIGSSIALGSTSNDDLKSDGILEPNKILYSEKISEDQIKHYELVNMQPNVLYDIRISYPAYTPADFTMKIFKQDTSGRQLLNIESVKFRTDNRGNIEGFQFSETESRARYWVSVAMTGTAVSVNPQLVRAVEYNIILEPISAVLWNVGKMVLLLALLLVALKLAWPRLMALVNVELKQQ